ncbi:CPBP family glutamic-type intramembrane protease [Aquipuribacter sp. SD81]|uniref:CPBP family glutamic-type intramembrane protease n=1 Tax=Aquipuribacter sp. SD81 TaxID=3127703 RepID=UPI0030179752
MDLLLAGAVVVCALVAWTAWESVMAARLRRDRRPLVARNAAVAGAQRLTVVGQLAVVVVTTAAAALTGLALWWSPVGVAAPALGWVAGGALGLGAAGLVAWVARRRPLARDRRALAATVATAVGTEVVLRGFGLSVLEAAGSPVTVSVLVAAAATGGLQAWRSRRGTRATAFVLGSALGFALGLVVLLTGSVVAAAALHVGVAVLGLLRTLPDPARAGGCACGQEHDHDAATTTSDVVPGTAVPAGHERVDAPGAGAVTPAAAHACGSSCAHHGTSACTTCPLQAARV